MSPKTTTSHRSACQFSFARQFPIRRAWQAMDGYNKEPSPRLILILTHFRPGRNSRWSQICTNFGTLAIKRPLHLEGRGWTLGRKTRND